MLTLVVLGPVLVGASIRNCSDLQTGARLHGGGHKDEPSTNNDEQQRQNQSPGALSLPHLPSRELLPLKAHHRLQGFPGLVEGFPRRLHAGLGGVALQLHLARLGRHV